MLTMPEKPKCTDKNQAPVTRDMVLEQLEEMGYSRDILPPSVIEAFLKELGEESTQDSLDEESYSRMKHIARLV